MRVLVVSPEAGRWPRVAGLAETVNHLVSAYESLGIEVRCYSPCLQCNHPERDAEIVPIWQGEDPVRHQVYQVGQDPVDGHYHIRHEEFFHREGLYHDAFRKPYTDNHFRFGLLASGAIHHALETGFIPDVIHAHEWGGALACAYAKGIFAKQLPKTQTLLTLHNLEYDSHFLESDIEQIGLDRQKFTLDGFEFWGKVSLLKVGVLYADQVVVTSTGYRGRLFHRDLSGGIRGFLEHNSEKLTGLQHGVDYECWDRLNRDQQKLPLLKTEARTQLQLRIGLPAKRRFQLYVNLDRDTMETAQTLFTVFTDLVKLDLTMVIGVSDHFLDREYLLSLQRHNPDQVAIVELNQEATQLAQILAGSDALFLAATEEPSASIVLKAMANGTIPITTHDCGCLDLLIGYQEASSEQSNSFLVEELRPDRMLRMVRKAQKLFAEKEEEWDSMVQRAYQLRVPWKTTAQSYLDLVTSPVK